MKILVSGAAGFIGSHLCDRLLDGGHDVVAVDNFSTGRAGNIRHLAGQPRFRLVEQDLTVGVPDDDRYDAIFHLASPASPVGYMQRQLETLLVNSVGTHRLLELARRDQARFLITSTSEIYGDPLQHPQREDYWGNCNPIGPRACYDEGKRYAEALTITYLRLYGLDARIVRIFNTYGPRNDPNDGRIVPNFITQALRGEPITVYGEGTQTRSFCYVSDLVRGLLAVMFTDGLAGEVFNLGNPGEQSAREFAELIKRLAGSPSPIVRVPGRPEEIARREPDIGKVRRVLGWQPEVSLEAGLRETIAWFRDHPGANGAPAEGAELPADEPEAGVRESGWR